MSLKLRRGTNAERLTITPDVGELIYTTDTKQLYAGDGTTVGGTLVSYNGSLEGPLGGNLILNGNNITGTGNINITGTITSTGNITTQGNVIVQGNVTLGDGSSPSDTVTISAEVNSDIVPRIDQEFNLGSQAKKWDTVYANNVFGDLEGNVRSQTSDILVDSYAGVLRGTLEGVVSNPGNTAVQGDVLGNVNGELTGPVKAGDGTVILDNGTDGTDAQFYGTFNGVFNGTIANGVVTTQVYSDPSWIASLNGSKIFGVMNDITLINSNFQGDVFSDDSSLLIDGQRGVLLGTHEGNLIGSVYTGLDPAIPGALSIIGNTIATDTDDDLILTTQGDGVVSVPGIIEVGRLNVGNDPATGGIRITHSNNSSQPFTTFGVYDGASSSTGTGAAAIFSRARGTTSIPASLQNGDEIATIVFAGATATPGIPSSFKDAANIMAKAVTVSTGSHIEGRLEFRTTNSSGVNATKLAINGDGSLEMTDSALLPAAVDIAGGPVKFVKVFIGATAYAMPLYAII